MKTIGTVKVHARPYAGAMAQNDSRLLVTNQDDDSVSVIDTETLKELDKIEVGGKPEGIGTHPDDRHVYVANWFDPAPYRCSMRNPFGSSIRSKPAKAAAHSAGLLESRVRSAYRFRLFA